MKQVLIDPELPTQTQLEAMASWAGTTVEVMFGDLAKCNRCNSQPASTGGICEVCWREL